MSSIHYADYKTILSPILKKQLRRKRYSCMIGMGATSDSYIHLEDELRVARGCLELIEKYGILHRLDDVFRYMYKFESKIGQQMSIFDVGEI